MKKILLLLSLLMVTLNLSAQQFLRYYMNDSTFRGFYTKDISRIYHDEIQTKIKVNHTNVTLNLNAIDSVGVEDVMVTDAPFKGDYRIYKYDFDRAKCGFSKLVVDNRANAIISKTGDFGSNDTILFVSKYHGYQFLMMTDEDGKIRKVFDGKRLIYYDGKLNCVEILRNTYHVLHKANEDTSVNRTMATKGKIKFNMSLLMRNPIIESLADFGLGKGLDFLSSLENIENNPNNRNMFLLKDGLSIGGDILALSLALGATNLTFGASAVIVGIAAEQLIEDSISLYNHLFPDAKQMKVMKNYYQDYYGINVLALAADYITTETAELNGSVSTLDKIKGELFFNLEKSGGTPTEFLATKKSNQDNFYTYHYFAQGLEWGTRYTFNAVYKCKVDGLNFEYPSSNSTTFYTLSPKVMTGVERSVEKNSAVVGATFENVPHGASCGVEYEANGQVMEQMVSPNDGVEVEVTLTGLSACTKYNYRAFMKIGEKTIYGKYQVFTTNSPDITGAWKCSEKVIDRKGEVSYRYYTLTLKKDGSVAHSEIKGTNTNDGMVPLRGNWSISSGGRVNISICIQEMNSNNYYSSVDQTWRGKLNNLENPSQIKGTTSQAASSGNGWHESDPNEFVLTR